MPSSQITESGGAAKAAVADQLAMRRPIDSKRTSELEFKVMMLFQVVGSWVRLGAIIASIFLGVLRVWISASGAAVKFGLFARDMF